MNICAIHQPNFFPWLGYFNKIIRSDVFVFLDDVQHQKTGGTWSNRVRMLVSGRAGWVTAPIKRPNGTLKVNQIEFLSRKWRKKIRSTIQTNYGRTSYFKALSGPIFDALEFQDNNLVSFNVNSIRVLCDLLDIPTREKFVLSSSLASEASSTEKLIEITKLTDCDAYLEGGGASGYQSDELFKESGIKLIKQCYQQPPYSQLGQGPFVPGLSILDCLFNCGTERTKLLLANDKGE